MSEILVKEKDIVVPGEILAVGMDNLPGDGTYREGDNIKAQRLGLVNLDGRTIKLIHVAGAYMPKRDDLIICKVTDISLNGWMLDIYSAYHAMLGLKDASSDFIRKGADLSQYFAIGDYMVGKIVNVTSQKLVDVSLKGPGLRKLSDGRIIRVSSNKVPRIIGKAGSMVSMIKNITGCRITVGQNGVIWLSGEPEGEYVAMEAIKMIEAKAHEAGLTDKVKIFLEEKTGKKIGENGVIRMTYDKRMDGRTFDELREIEAKVGVIPNANGSAYFKIGKTWAYAAVYGPRNLYPRFMQNPTTGILRCHYAMMPFSGTGDRVRPGPNRRAKEISMVTEKALLPAINLSQYPNTVVDVYVELPQTDAGSRCAGICAASMALADAGIEMTDLVSAVSTGRVDDKVVIDLDYAEEAYEHGPVADIPVAVMSNSDQITLLQMDGPISKEMFNEALTSVKIACKKIYEIQKNALKQKFVGEEQ